MPATSTVQSRISTFESLGRPSPSPSPPNLGRKTSLIDLKDADWILDDGPSAPLISFESPRPPPPTLRPKPASLSTAYKAYSSSRADSNTLSVEHAHRYPPLSPDPHSPRNAGHAPSSSISSFHSVSLSSDTDSSTPGSVANFIATFPMDHDHRQHTTDTDAISLSESYEDVSTSSLASPATERLIALDWEKALAKGKQRSPVPPKLPQRPPSRSPSTTTTTPSFNYKHTPPPSHPVSRATSVAGSTPTSPILLSAAASSSSSLASAATTLTNPPYTPRRPAPPPPPPPLPSRSSDRSSIRSIATTNSSSSFSAFSQSIPPSSYSLPSQQQQQRSTLHHTPSLLSLAAKTKRPTPVPLAARRRYEAVFTANVIQRRRAEKRRSNESASKQPALLSPSEARGRRAVGWRGLSIDLITGDELAQSPVSPGGVGDDDRVDENVGPDEKLEASIVRFIWKRSGLSNAHLSDIWNECDITGKGALSLDGFTKGMWRIDEELRRTNTQAIKSATNGAAAYRSNSLRSTTSTNSSIAHGHHQHRQHHLHRPRDILR